MKMELDGTGSTWRPMTSFGIDSVYSSDSIPTHTYLYIQTNRESNAFTDRCLCCP